ncbi:hypothetical protein CONPUDRAFT_166714 [Coniophora puteana RWD-64-598 SS2]|uniref:DUF6533 domain-containing protein n=1 Tax=Coniophora puteana (strain RWD-64-598) TaxID=741705 RepID=A0A5M3MIG4_CONPW|nr:uncharacterized protein CONPUDRAFT_166714 [Coniophora puteana RWD-64-598 SS2]EIW78796.1 hypothetical protein CONPUDRAFT_166714 [Coniophora puteana RWD-64-598 SS2]
MSSASLQQELDSLSVFLWTSNYTMVAVTALVVYDYLLNLALEVELIWVSFGLLSTHLAPGPAYTTIPGKAAFVDNICLPDDALSGVSVYWRATTDRLKHLVDERTGGPKSTPEIVLYDIYNSCDQLFPAWVYITSDVAAVSFELFLFALALGYACRHIPSSFWRNPAAAATSLATVIVRDNLVYFFVATLSMATNAAIEIPSAATSNTFSSIAMIAQSVLVAMIGPWMVISLRRSYEQNTGVTTSRSHEVTTVAFATHPVVSQDGGQDKSEV